MSESNAENPQDLSAPDAPAAEARSPLATPDSEAAGAVAPAPETDATPLLAEAAQPPGEPEDTVADSADLEAEPVTLPADTPSAQLEVAPGSDAPTEALAEPETVGTDAPSPTAEAGVADMPDFPASPQGAAATEAPSPEAEADDDSASLEVEATIAQAAETPGAQPSVEGETASGPVDEPDDDRQWYVVHCYSGYENKVRHNLEQRIETMGMKDKIFDVVVPTEEEIEVKDGKRRTVERRVFPGYILVQMLLNEDSWYVVRNTPGVTGFVGMGNEPTPLRPEEVAQIVRRMEADAPRVKVTYKAGQKVRITDGPFNDFIGTVADIDMERAKVRVMVSFFGRETPVELDFLQVEKA